MTYATFPETCTKTDFSAEQADPAWARYQQNLSSQERIFTLLTDLEQNDVVRELVESTAAHQLIGYEYGDVCLNFRFASPSLAAEISYEVESELGQGRESLRWVKRNAQDYNDMQGGFHGNFQGGFVVPEKYNARDVPLRGCLQRAEAHLEKLTQAVQDGTAKRTVLRPR